MIPSHLTIALGFTLVACADPTYREPRDGEVAAMGGSAAVGALDAGSVIRAEAGFDAGLPVGPVVVTEMNALPDASGPVVLPTATEALPDWALPLLGSYATQAFSFSKDRIGIVSVFEELSLAQIERAGGGAQLRTRLCSMVASSVEDELRLVDPSGLPEVIRQVTFDDAGHWGTAGTPVGHGYERSVPADCVGKENQSIARRDHQTWLTSGTCRCPSSVNAAPRIDDCRVLDLDHDMKPGLTYTDKGKPGAFIGSFIDTTIYAVIASRSHAVRGRVDALGAHYADLFVDEVAYQLSCEPSGCPQLGDVGRPCTSDFNSLHFVPLPAHSPITSCAQLLMRRAELFPSKAPATPSTCSQQVLTDDPTRP
jgi:hypothetical protein